MGDAFEGVELEELRRSVGHLEEHMRDHGRLINTHAHRLEHVIETAAVDRDRIRVLEDRVSPPECGMADEVTVESDGARIRRMGTDARAWAAELADELERAVWDEGWLATWFANAIEAGRLAGQREPIRVHFDQDVPAGVVYGVSEDLERLVNDIASGCARDATWDPPLRSEPLVAEADEPHPADAIGMYAERIRDLKEERKRVDAELDRCYDLLNASVDEL